MTGEPTPTASARNPGMIPYTCRYSCRVTAVPSEARARIAAHNTRTVVGFRLKDRIGA